MTGRRPLPTVMTPQAPTKGMSQMPKAEAAMARQMQQMQGA